jgi:SAM-dependent methyltransferase
VSTQAGSARVRAERFERLYETSPDPWRYRSSEYEREKYAATLAALGSGTSYRRTLEIGCSIGVFTELLAQRCEWLVAIDFSSRALELAREQVGNLANVEVLRRTFPDEVPPGTWDLVVCSEILYYLDFAALTRAVRWLHEQLTGGATVIAVSWRGGEGESEPFTGDEVHDLMRVALSQWHVFDGRRPGYRLDRFCGQSAPSES